METRFSSSGWYMRTKCASTWQWGRQSRRIRRKCEKFPRSFSLENLLFSLPVSTPTFTYSNVYCAQCNYESLVPDSLTYWTPILSCNLKKTRKNDTEPLSAANTTKNASMPIANGTTVPTADDTSNVDAFFASCEIAYFKPPQINVSDTRFDPIRPCVKSVGTCLNRAALNAKLGYNISISNYTHWKERCQSYTDYVKSEYGGGKERYYQNCHCAFCSGLELNTSNVSWSKKLLFPPIFSNYVNLSTALNFSSTGSVSVFFNGTSLFLSKNCIRGHVYDASKRKCVLLWCHSGVLWGGKCLKLLDIRIVPDVAYANDIIIKVGDGIQWIEVADLTENLVYPAFGNASNGSNSSFAPNGIFSFSRGCLYVSNGYCFVLNVEKTVYIAIGLLSSVICFFLAFTYFGFKDLRTYAGLCMASYALSLGLGFIASVFTVLPALVSNLNPVLCTLIGFLSHYFFLCYFTWSSVIALNLFQTFVTSRMQKIEGKNLVKRFVLASLYAWSAPALVCIVCVILQYKSGVDISYSSDTACMLQPDAAVLYTVAIPVGLIVIFNLCSYIAVVVVLRKDLQIAATLRGDSEKKIRLETIKKEARAFLGMFVLLGLSSTCVCIAYIYDREWLWYLSAGASLFQAVTLLFIFVLNQKVRRLYGAQFKCKREKKDDSIRKPRTEETAL